MTAPRLEVRLGAIGHNARTLVTRLAARGIAVTAVAKVALGDPRLAQVLVDAGARSLGDSRIENVEALRQAGITAHVTLVRAPMLSQVARVVRHTEVSCNTELEVVAALSTAAVQQGRTHGVVLMVELGDLREGIMAGDLVPLARVICRLPGIRLVGVGTNLACRSGVVPDAAKMAELSTLATEVEAACEVTLDVVTGGNSANLDWALGAAAVGRIDDLRLGEAILLGREPLRRRPITGLHTDAFTLVAEVIESKIKPSLPWGETAQTAFGAPEPAVDEGPVAQSLLAIGRQDIDPDGLQAPAGTTIVGASSDHLVVTSASRYAIGAELRFAVDYSALLRAMTSPAVTVDVITAPSPRPPASDEGPGASTGAVPSGSTSRRPGRVGAR